MNRLFLKYKSNQVVIYGDILGFKSFIAENYNNNNLPTDHSGINCYIDIFHYLDTNIFTDEFRARTGINFIWLSDSFAFAGDVKKWTEIKERFIDFACELFCMGFIFKGAITFGDMHNEVNMMGMPLVEATQIEKDLHMPEIQISEKAAQKISFSQDELYKKDGKNYFDYLYALFSQRIARGCFESTFHVVSDVSVTGLNNEDHIKQKYEYLIEQIKNAVAKLKVYKKEDIAVIKSFEEGSSHKFNLFS